MNSEKQILMAFASFLAGHAAECKRVRVQREGEYKVNGLFQKQNDIANMLEQERACEVVSGIVQWKIDAMGRASRPKPEPFDHGKHTKGQDQ